MCVCACIAKAIWVPNSVSVGKPHPWAFFLTGWAAGEVVLWEGRQGSWHSKWKPGILFSINIMCQETCEAPECNLPPQSGQKMNLNGGGSTANWESASASGTVLCWTQQVPEGHQRLGATEAETELVCSEVNSGEKNYFLKNTLGS